MGKSILIPRILSATMLNVMIAPEVGEEENSVDDLVLGGKLTPEIPPEPITVDLNGILGIVGKTSILFECVSVWTGKSYSDIPNSARKGNLLQGLTYFIANRLVVSSDAYHGSGDSAKTFAMGHVLRELRAYKSIAEATDDPTTKLCEDFYPTKKKQS